MDVFSCVHDFIIANKLCAAPLPEKMNIAATGLSLVRSAGKSIERGSLCAKCVLWVVPLCFFEVRQEAAKERMRPHNCILLTRSDSETSESTEPSPRTGCNAARVNIERLLSTMARAGAGRMAA